MLQNRVCNIKLNIQRRGQKDKKGSRRELFGAICLGSVFTRGDQEALTSKTVFFCSAVFLLKPAAWTALAMPAATRGTGSGNALTKPP
jgi:hypothetical protein